VNIHAERSSEPAEDILELGTALVAATPQFSETVRRLTGNSGEVCHLVQATLREAWLRRQGYSREDTVHDWLVGVLRRQILH